MTSVGSALFDINDDGEDHGYAGTNGEVFRLKLRQPAGAGSVIFQVYREGSDPALGIAANPPRASSDAPLITLVGTSSGGAVSPATPADEVEGTLPVSGSHSYIIRCIRDRGQRTLSSGRVVVDPSLVHERGIYIPAGTGLRKIVATETNQFGIEGWAEPLNALIANGTTSGSFLAPGTGAVARSVSSRLSDEIYVTDYMTAEEITDAYDGTFLFDHQPAIQQAIDYALFRSEALGEAAGPRVMLPAGVLRCDRTIHMNYGIDFRSVQLIGHGIRQGGTYSKSACGTSLVAFFDDAPLIAVQGARDPVIRDMSLYQELVGAHILNVCQNDPASMAHLSPAAWVDASFPASASSRYAPQCAIAVDPYSGVAPGTAYPAVDYPDFLGVVPQYGKGFSRNLLVENVMIWGFVVGIAQQPCNADANGDFTKLRRVEFYFCVYGFSWGNTQARSNALYDCIFAYVHTALASTVHGLQIGNPQISVYSCSFEIGYQLFDIGNLNYGNGPLFVGCFGEALYRLGRGNAGNAFRQGGMRFQNCEWGFSWWSRYGVPTHVLEWLDHSGLCIFDTCFFYMPDAIGYLGFKATGTSNEGEPARCFKFVNCQVDGQSIELDEEYQRSAYNATQRIVVSNASCCMDEYSVHTGHLANIDTGEQSVPRLIATPARAPRVYGVPVYASRVKCATHGADPGIPVGWKAANLPAATVGAIDGRLLEVTYDGSVTTASLMHTGGDVGDVVISADNGIAFLVRSRTGSAVLLEAMNGYDKDENFLESLPGSTTLWPINCRRYTLAGVVYADITAESEVMTNVIMASGSFANIPTLFTVGDFLYVDTDVETIIQPTQANIVSWDNTAKTITFGGDFMVTQQRRRIAIFVRPALPNVAA